MSENGVVRCFEANSAGTDWVVGDLHGCYATLELMLEEVGFDRAKDRLFSVGDLADRGPESGLALDYLVKPWFHAVRGNHEQFLLDSVDNYDTQLIWLINGGGWFSAQSNDVQAAFVEAFSDLPYLIEIATEAGTAGIVHADVPLGLAWGDVRRRVEKREQDVLDALLWSRYRAITKGAPPVEGVSRVFCGHTPVRPAARVVGNVHLIDQGAVFGLERGIPDSGLTIVTVDGSRVHTRAPIWPRERVDGAQSMEGG